MVSFNSFNSSRQIYRIFIVSMSSLTWLRKNLVRLFISFLLKLIGSWKRFCRFVKQTLFKIIIARSPVYFILFSYNHFYVTYCAMLRSVDVSISVNSSYNGPSINIFDKNLYFSFSSSSSLPYDVRKYQRINLLATKGNASTLSFFSILLLSLNFLRKWTK